jgi:2-polyprenyl-3-methyl-5-hydroxy-6-metoxy-1,4-benzoquinol methylase
MTSTEPTVTKDAFPEPAPPQAATLKWLLGAFYTASAIAVLVAIASSVDRASGRVFPSIVAIVCAFLALVGALRCLASAWASLLPGRAPARELRRCVYASQPGKYIPGGVVNTVGQLALARQAGVGLKSAVPAYVVYTAHAAFGSLAVGAVLATSASAVGARWALLATGLGLVAVASASRPVLERMLNLAQRIVPRLRTIEPLPDQKAMTRGFVLQMGFAALQGTGYAVLLRSVDRDVPFVAALGAYALAFGLGLLAVPVPSGLLVREAILVAVLHPVAGVAAVVTAAVVQRLVAITAELSVLAVNRLAPHRPVRNIRPTSLRGRNVTQTPAKTKYDGLLSPYLRNLRHRMALPMVSGRVLDVGCADGYLASFVSPESYVGVDADAEVVSEARRAHPGHTFMTNDELEPTERFDTIVSLAVIEHVEDPEGFLGRWCRHLEPDGRVVLTTPYSRWEPVHGLASKVHLTSPEAHEEHQTTFDKESLEQLFTATGLSMTVYKRFLFHLNQLAVGSLEPDRSPGDSFEARRDLQETRPT